LKDDRTAFDEENLQITRSQDHEITKS